MPNSIIARKNQSDYYQKLDHSAISKKGVDSAKDEGWTLLGEILEYPDSWISVIRNELLKHGKLWRWNVLEQPQIEGKTTFARPSHNKELQPAVQTWRNVLLVIGATTTMNNFEGVIRSFEEHPHVRLFVVYTAKPPLLDGVKTESEVDFKFTLELERGRKKLLESEKLARDFGFDVETSFVWSDSVEGLIKKLGKTQKDKRPFDMVLDVRDIPDDLKTSTSYNAQ